MQAKCVIRSFEKVELQSPQVFQSLRRLKLAQIDPRNCNALIGCLTLPVGFRDTEGSAIVLLLDFTESRQHQCPYPFSPSLRR